ncbi:MAG TPA: ABC transporter ATP-binding protein [Candidatus Binatia bacterium]|nr:ABC transporter ATP-binding protein [Candidatus Binatia bacterium]
MAEPLLRVVGLSKNFSGLAAVDAVSLELDRGEVHAIIGPNGAGKTTLLNLVSGDLESGAGSILFRGHDISHLPSEKRSRLGIGRTYQKTNIFPPFTVFENCRLAAQSQMPRTLDWLHNALDYTGVNQQAERALATVGLSDRAMDVAAVLSHGEQRQLEIGMCLAAGPELLLLDEPLAGMGAEESIRMIELLGRLATNHAILLVEHDMDAVFQLARRLTVMANGKVLATGTPAEIRSNREVQTAYLGREPNCRDLS